MVPPLGIAPRSSANQADTLLLSYGGIENWSRAPVLPRVPPRSKRGGFADSLARDLENWRPVRALLPRPSARQAAALRC